MISKQQANWFCNEDITKIYGYSEAIADKNNTWDCHHCLGLIWSKKELIKMGLYYNQPPEYLMFVTRKNHAMLHNKFGFNKDDISTKISNKLKGIKRNYETRIKMRLNQPSRKLVFQYTKDGKFVKLWESAHEVQRQLGFHHTNISACCLGKSKSAYDYFWTYNPLN